MIHEIDDRINFGQYRGLTIREIYQGTLNIDRTLITSYLIEIFNEKQSRYSYRFGNDYFVEFYVVDQNYIRTIGEILDPDEPESPENVCIIGDIKAELSYFINNNIIHHPYRAEFLDVEKDFRKFNKEQEIIKPIGADPEYLIWCEQTFDHFEISVTAKETLQKLPIARFTGIDLLYIGNETYEYSPRYSIEQFTFPENEN